MKKRLVLFLVGLLVNAGVAFADGLVSGIIVTAEGSTKAYALTETPKVTYSESEGIKYAHITLKGQTEPALTVELKAGQRLLITFGTYDPAGIEGVESDVVLMKEKQGKKYFYGGQLIIVSKDGKLYDSTGREVK